MNEVVSWKDERKRILKSAPAHVGRGPWARETREVLGCRLAEHRKLARKAPKGSLGGSQGAFAKQTSIAPVAPMEEQFLRLVDEWRSGIGGVSSATQIILHPAYQAIIGLGPDAIPLVLRELTRRPAHWNWALRALTNQNPVPAEAAGNLRAIASAWLDWGRRRHLIS